MRTVVLLLACLANVQIMDAYLDVTAKGKPSPSKMLTKLLLSFHPEAAFSLAGPRTHFPVDNPISANIDSPNKFNINKFGHNSIPASPTTFSSIKPAALARGRTSPIIASVVAKEDYRLAAAFGATGLLIFVAPVQLGALLLLFGSFLALQTARIRFVFDEDAFEVKTKPFSEVFSSSDALTDTGENFAVGGENRWKYNSFVNWDFFPSSSLPILVYFKEVQTPSDKWDVGPGKWANSDDALAKGAVKGQVHFFPCIANAQELKDNFIARECAKL